MATRRPRLSWRFVYNLGFFAKVFTGHPHPGVNDRMFEFRRNAREYREGSYYNNTPP